ncbi:RHS repeat domain-containing protein [Akkermansia sp.]
MKTNNSMNIQNGVPSVPVYQRWYSSPKMVQAARGRAMVLNEEPEPEPEPWHVVWNKSFSDSYYKGKPSTSGDHMETAEKSFTVPSAPTPQPTEEDPTPAPPEPLEATCNMTLTVDDWGKMSVGQSSTVAQEIDMTSGGEGPQGGHAKWTKESGEFTLKSGEYTLHVEQSNIDYDPPENNISVCDYEFEAHIDKEGPATAGGKKKPDCDCCNFDGQGGGCPPPPAGRSRSAAPVFGNTSSGGENAQAISDASLMYWGADFGHFRGLGGISTGSIELLATDSTDGLNYPHALCYDSMLASFLDIPEVGIVAGGTFDIVTGAGRVCVQCEVDRKTLTIVGEFTSSGNRAFFTTVDGVLCVQWMKTDKSVAVYNARTGALVSYTTRWGNIYTAEQIGAYLRVNRDSAGDLLQVWNLWDGLLNIEAVTADGYTIALYTPSQITGQDEQGLYTVMGEPFKKFVMAGDAATGRFSVTEQTPGRLDFKTEWWLNGKAWNMAQGTDAEAIVTRRTRTELEKDTWQLVTAVSRGEDGAAASHVCEVYQTTAYGDLLLTKVDGYGSDLARTTTYEYDYYGRKKKETRPDGGVWEWSYDMLGRLTLERQPWCGGKSQDTTYRYVTGDGDSEVSSDVAEERRLMRDGSNNPIELWKKTYTYSQADHVRRVEIRTTALETETVQLEVQETWLGSAPNSYAQGRIKMTQAVNGVQTHYEYAATTQHGAAYTETQETRVNGEVVPGLSVRKVSFITPQGTTVREESHVLLSDNTWTLTDSADYEFDTMNRWTKRTRGNGRVSEQESICDGRILWEKDEDGVRTDYGYDSARLLVETIRSATVTTPETIVSYTKDALDRATATRTDTGAMSVTTETAYDLLGRITSETDSLGRITTHSYSANGLTETVTTPMGGTLITQRHADGTILRQHGTGQQDLKFETDMASDGLRVTTTVLNGTARVVRGRVITDGFGQQIRVATVHTRNGSNYRHLTYNAKGQLVRDQLETLAPTLYEYDSFGNKTKETVALSDEPTTLNSRVMEYAYTREQREEGVYGLVTTTEYAAEGTPIVRKEATLVSSLNPVLESKVVTTDARGHDNADWTEYGEPAARVRKVTQPGVSDAAVIHTVDGFTTTVTDYAGISASQSRAYTAQGMTMAYTDSRGNTTTEVYDTALRLLSVTDAAENSTSYAYGQPLDHPTCITDAMGKTACYAYDARGRKEAEWGTAIQPAVFSYNDADQITGLTTFRGSSEAITTDPRERTDGDMTAWNYNAATGLPTRKTYADNTHKDISYDTLNRVSTFTNGRGNVMTRSYDALTGLLTGETYGEGTPSITAAYNHLGQLTGITDASGTRSFTYNQYGEVEGESTLGLVESSLAAVKDAYGRASGYSLQYGVGTVLQTGWGYDSAGRPSTVSLNAVATPFTYGYNAANGLLETLNYPNTLKRWYTLEEKRDLVVKMDYLRPGSQNYPAKVDYTYDSLGRPATKKDYFNTPTPDLVHTYTYNDRSEVIADALSRGGTYTFAYDNGGNRTNSLKASGQRSYASNMLNQYSSICDDDGTTVFMLYDEDGNQTAILTSSGEWMVSYNALNQATTFTQGSKRIECVYDYLNRRVEKTVYDGETLVSRKRFIYLGYLQVAELDATNETETASPILRKTYLWDPVESVATRILAMSVFDEAGVYQEDLYYTHDLLKNTTALFGIQGGRRALYEYGPYGDIIKMEGNAAEINPFRFSSEYLDDDLGLVYYNYRYYNVVDGRWINRDPMAENAGFNLYCFVGNGLSIDYLGLVNFDGLLPGLKDFLEKQARAEAQQRCITFCKEHAPKGTPNQVCTEIGKQLAKKLEEIAKMAAHKIEGTEPPTTTTGKPGKGEGGSDNSGDGGPQVGATATVTTPAFAGNWGTSVTGTANVGSSGGVKTGGSAKPVENPVPGVSVGVSVSFPIGNGGGSVKMGGNVNFPASGGVGVGGNVTVTFTF